MTTSRTIDLLRILFIAFATLIGFLCSGPGPGQALQSSCLGAVLGLSTILVDRLIHGIRLRVFSSATFGLLIGLVFAHLLRASEILLYVPERTAWVLSLCTYCFFAYLGMMLAMRSNRDEFSMIIPYVRFRQQSVQEMPLLVDTNILIDGRIVELAATNYLQGPIVVPRFVLVELQHLSDSADPLKRERGRRGLSKLQEMQATESMGISIHEAEAGRGMVDGEMIRLAQMLGARIVSNDTGLAQVARLQKVTVLNLNDIAKALQTKNYPGDELELHLVKEGRDFHQAIGYREDGTMVIVNHARHLLGKTVNIVIGSNVQTNAGRLTFAELTNPAERLAAEPSSRTPSYATERGDRHRPESNLPSR